MFFGSLFGGGSNLPPARPPQTKTLRAFLYIFGDQGEFAKLDLPKFAGHGKRESAQIDRLRDVVAPYVPVTAAHAFGSWQPGNVLYGD